MKIEIPNPDNPFNEQKELEIAWEMGWYKRNEDIFTHMAEISKWSVQFRQQVRNALFPYYPNNPCSTDDELIEAIKRLIAKHPQKV